MKEKTEDEEVVFLLVLLLLLGYVVFQSKAEVAQDYESNEQDQEVSSQVKH
ncbi:MAG TPA: hypothetical protein VGI33_10665 [Paenibacillus sp.]|jgi:CHASE3 domain sensor protein